MKYYHIKLGSIRASHDSAVGMTILEVDKFANFDKALARAKSLVSLLSAVQGLGHNIEVLSVTAND